MENQDNIEKFITKNRQELDVFEPPSGMWEKIYERLEEEEVTTPVPRVISFRVRTLWRVAAMGLILIGMYWMFFFQANSPTQNEQAFDLAKFNPELAEAENYYSQLIEEKRQEIAKFPLTELNLEKDFKKDLSELDTLYQRLKDEFFKTSGREEVMAAMILNLQLRIEILNKQLHILQQIQKIKKGNNHENKQQI